MKIYVWVVGVQNHLWYIFTLHLFPELLVIISLVFLERETCAAKNCHCKISISDKMKLGDSENQMLKRKFYNDKREDLVSFSYQSYFRYIFRLRLLPKLSGNLIIFVFMQREAYNG